MTIANCADAVLRMAFAFLLCLCFCGVASANPWAEAEEQQAKEAARKADENWSNTKLFARVICVATGGVLVWLAVSIARNGLGFGPRPRRLSGLPAWTVAGVIAVFGLVVAVGGLLFAPLLLIELFPRS